MSIRSIAALLAAALFVAPALAAETHPYAQKSFEAARAAGKPILVAIHAPWCPTCKAQAAILERLERAPKFAGLQVFQVDFDSQKEALRAFRATTQSTLIVYRGGAEAGRSAGDADAASIAALLDRAL